MIPEAATAAKSNETGLPRRASRELGPSEREGAIELLRKRLSPRALRRVVADEFGRRPRRKTIEWLVAETEATKERLQSKLPDGELSAFLVDVQGVDLLSMRSLRHELADGAAADELDELFSYGSAGHSPRSHARMVRAVAQRNWHPGKSWPKQFAQVFGFPSVFAGVEGLPTVPENEEILPFRPLPILEDFQIDVKGQVLEVLRAAAGSNRGILSLPTGAGKTRTAVEALVEWRLTEPAAGSIIWIAHSEELCEQAIQAFREVWIDLGHRPPHITEGMTVYRLWGGHRKIPEDPDFVVASIQELHAIVRGDASARRSSLEQLAQTLGVVVVDEAHRLEARSYVDVLNVLGIDLRKSATSQVPLLGLTATPYRASATEAKRLAERFHRHLLAPTNLGLDLVAALRDRGVLARPVHQFIDYGRKPLALEQDKRFSEYFEQFNDIHPDILRDLGENTNRNKLILKGLCELPASWPVLFFGCSVEHAMAISVLLRRRGRSSEVVTGTTRPATRRFLIDEFRRGRISVLSNYGVLTTGFDAPRVRALVIARPTTSAVLYAQMIGRGMRGPTFGGTDECLVIDVRDNIRFNGVETEAYREYWR
jgi:superfamily II DNA or RNA helicase